MSGPTLLDILETEFECDGETITVSTPRNPGESNEDFASRHRREVEEAKQECIGNSAETLPEATYWMSTLGRMTYSSRGMDRAKYDANVADMKKYFPPASST